MTGVFLSSWQSPTLPMTETRLAERINTSVIPDLAGSEATAECRESMPERGSWAGGTGSGAYPLGVRAAPHPLLDLLPVNREKEDGRDAGALSLSPPAGGGREAAG